MVKLDVDRIQQVRDDQGWGEEIRKRLEYLLHSKKNCVIRAVRGELLPWEKNCVC